MYSGFVHVEGGRFSAPSVKIPGNRKSAASYVQSFYISKFQVTQDLYSGITKVNPSNFRNPESPVEMITWYEAISFCNQQSIFYDLIPYYEITRSTICCNAESEGFRLPTEIEWEYAASGGKNSRGYTYSGSNDLDSSGWYKNNSGGNTHAVGLKIPNELGIYDMSGNVWEWCFDANPESNTKIYKGGSFLDFDYGCTISASGHRPPNLKQIDIGFRLVKNIFVQTDNQ